MRISRMSMRMEKHPHGQHLLATLAVFCVSVHQAEKLSETTQWGDVGWLLKPSQREIERKQSPPPSFLSSPFLSHTQSHPLSLFYVLMKQGCGVGESMYLAPPLMDGFK